MIALRLDNVAFSHPGGPMLEKLTWAIAERAKVGLVGPNGAGKSTLLQLLAGQLTPDNGLVVTAKGVRVGYLPQDIAFAEDRPVLAEDMTASPQLAAIKAEFAEL